MSERYLEGVWKLSDKPNLNHECGTSIPACLSYYWANFNQTFGPNFCSPLDQIFFWPNLFPLKNFHPKIFRTKNLGDPHFFGYKLFDLNYLEIRISLNSKLFLTQTFSTFWPNIFVWHYIFLDLHFFGPGFFRLVIQPFYDEILEEKNICWEIYFYPLIKIL